MKKFFTFVLLSAATMMGTAKAETVEINANLGYASYYESSEDWYLVLEDVEEGNAVALDFFSEDYTSIVGNWDSKAKDFDLSYTAVYIGEKEYEVTAATATITREGDVTKVSATLVAKDGNTYVVAFEDQLYGVEEDTYESDNTDYGLGYDEDAEMPVLFIDAVDEEAEAGAEFVLYFAGIAHKIASLNTGVYPIDDSGKAGTVLAEYSSVGTYSWFDGDKNNDPGFYYDYLFTLVSGSVTISEEDGLNMVVVEGVDYIGSYIYLSFTGDLSDIITFETGVKNTTATVKAEKSVRNGQLIIKRQNTEYNALGAIVK